MPVISSTFNSDIIDSLDDPRIAHYRGLRERDLRAEGVFITEGALLAERLLKSRFATESLFIAAGSEARLVEELALHGRGEVPVYIAEAALMREIVGFDFHRGVLGLGRRATLPNAASLVQQALESGDTLSLIACPGTETAENLGMILRSAAAFGIQGVLLPEAGADPFSRRCLRQSMGSALTVPLGQSADLLSELVALKRNSGLELVAAVAAGNAENEGAGHVVKSLKSFVWPRRSVLLVGNEFHGLESGWLEQCDHLVMIPVADDCDSLNVAVATGVFLYEMGGAK